MKLLTTQFVLPSSYPLPLAPKYLRQVPVFFNTFSLRFFPQFWKSSFSPHRAADNVIKNLSIIALVIGRRMN